MHGRVLRQKFWLSSSVMDTYPRSWKEMTKCQMIHVESNESMLKEARVRHMGGESWMHKPRKSIMDA